MALLGSHTRFAQNLNLLWEYFVPLGIFALKQIAKKLEK